jgi:hypothetical protein
MLISLIRHDVWTAAEVMSKTKGVPELMRNGSQPPTVDGCRTCDTTAGTTVPTHAPRIVFWELMSSSIGFYHINPDIIPPMKSAKLLRGFFIPSENLQIMRIRELSNDMMHDGVAVRISFNLKGLSAEFVAFHLISKEKLSLLYQPINFCVYVGSGWLVVCAKIDDLHDGSIVLGKGNVWKYCRATNNNQKKK